MRNNMEKIIKFAYNHFDGKRWSKKELKEQYNNFLKTGQYENIVNFMKYIDY